MSVPKAGALAKASDWTTVFPVDTDAWPPYTPTLVQSGAVTKTLNYSKYTKTGRDVTAQVIMAVTGTGTASNQVRIGLPVAAASAAGHTVGSAWIYDASTGNLFKGLAVLDNANYVTILDTSVNTIARLGEAASAFAVALAASDLVSMEIQYESLS